MPDELFELLFERWTDGNSPGLFERYNFTVVESGRFDEEVAVDPEMLGMVYERLVNVTFESGDKAEDLRGTAGIFYTPRTEIDLMCRLALVDWLGNHLGKDRADILYRWVFALSEEEKREADEAITQAGLWGRLHDLVRCVRVCDPACGSGSFLVGMLLILDDLQARCNQALGISETPYERRKRILQDQLYGVDVMEWAVRVAELRLWLQLVVETELHMAEASSSKPASPQSQPEAPPRRQPPPDPGRPGPESLPPGRAPHPFSPQGASDPAQGQEAQLLPGGRPELDRRDAPERGTGPLSGHL